jgi:hypothetical protein
LSHAQQQSGFNPRFDFTNPDFSTVTLISSSHPSAKPERTEDLSTALIVALAGLPISLPFVSDTLRGSVDTYPRQRQTYYHSSNYIISSTIKSSPAIKTPALQLKLRAIDLSTSFIDNYNYSSILKAASKAWRLLQLQCLIFTFAASTASASVTAASAQQWQQLSTPTATAHTSSSSTLVFSFSSNDCAACVFRSSNLFRLSKWQHQL